MQTRKAEIKRDTYETKIEVSINLDSQARAEINTGIGFLDHMLEQIARHCQIELTIKCDGDRHIDDHHSVEDIGIAFGQVLTMAIGNKEGINRYGHSYCPLDESLSRVVIDLSGRPGLFYFVEFPTEKIGSFDTELIQEFFQGFANNANATIHIDNLRGKNSHHIAESIFKAFAKALRVAIGFDEKSEGVIPSTKGKL